MAQRETILVPVDFSETSRLAVQRALGLASARGARIALLHACSMPPIGLEPGFSESLSRELARTEEKRLADFANEVDDGVVDVSTSFRQTDPARAIHEAARDPDVSMIVMGSHGRRGFDRWLLGSVAARTVEGAPKPVLIVRGDEETCAAPFRSILFATDFSDRAQRVEPLVADWARRFGAEVEVVHVIRETSVLLAPYAVVGSSDFEGEMFEAAECRMAEVLRRLGEHGVYAKSKIVYGLPAEEILRRAESTNVDLVAVGTRGYSGMQRFLLGSVAQRVLAQAPCSVIVDGDEAVMNGGRSMVAELRAESSEVSMAVHVAVESVVQASERAPGRAEAAVEAEPPMPEAEGFATRIFALGIGFCFSVIVGMIFFGFYL